MDSADITNSMTRSNRITSIDGLRGLVMLLMLVDHAREFFFMHAQVSDPVNLDQTPPDLFFTRLAAHLCAPVFVFLSGTAAWLYGENRQSLKSVSEFLFKRGLFLVFLEFTVVRFAWNFSFFSELFYFQVIWAIGISMISLAGLIYLPRKFLIALGMIIIFGHNFLDPISYAPNETGYTFWSILHDRGIIDLPFGFKARTSYPVLPWIGVIALGYSIGPWFSKTMGSIQRGKFLLITSGLSLVGFLVLRFSNLFGETKDWSYGSDTLMTVMSFLNLTKYPPSANFLLLTLAIGLFLLWLLERFKGKLVDMVAVFGSAPLFYYVIHIYGLNVMNTVGLALWGPNQGKYLSFTHVGYLWLLALLLAFPLWFACRWFANLKRKKKSVLLSYL